MRTWRICENKNGLFKIQFKALGFIWWDWRSRLGGILIHFQSHGSAEREIKRLIRIKNDRKLYDKLGKTWRCTGEYRYNRE